MQPTGPIGWLHLSCDGCTDRETGHCYISTVLCVAELLWHAIKRGFEHTKVHRSSDIGVGWNYFSSTGDRSHSWFVSP